MRIGLRQKSEPPTIKCADCGLIAWRHRETGQLVEVHEGYRRDFVYPSAISAFKFPMCTMAKRDIRTECDDEGNRLALSHLETPVDWKEMANFVRKILTSEYHCSEFAQYQMGFSPQEHREMLDRKWMIEHERRSQRVDRAWRFVEIFCAAVVGAGIARFLG